MRRLIVSALAVLCAPLAGCGGSRIVPVSGVVTLDGKPYKNAIVSFQPKATDNDPNPGRGSVGITDENGRYTLSYDGKEPGAVVGKHWIRIFTKQDAKDAPPDDKSESDSKVKVRYVEPIPIEWHEFSTKEFVVPAGGTDKANFDIVTKPAGKK